MKKGIAMGLVVLMAIVSVFSTAAAENTRSVQVLPQYEGSWLPVEQYGFRLYIPNDWAIGEANVDNALLTVVQPETGYVLLIEVLENQGGYTMDDLLTGFSQAEGFESVQALFLNGIAFVHYLSPEADMRAFTALSGDAKNILFFKFMPGADAALTSLAEQIMASLSPWPPAKEDAQAPSEPVPEQEAGEGLQMPWDDILPQT